MPDLNAGSLQNTIARRWFLKDCGVGLGALAATQLLADDLLRAPDAAGPKPPHFPGKTKNVIFLFMAGGGIKGGVTLGESDEFGFNAVVDRVHVRDLQATILHLPGFNHKQLSFSFQGLDQRITGVEPCRVVEQILS